MPLTVIGFFEQRQQARAELVLQGVAGRAGVEECVQRFVVPLEQALLRAGFQVRYVQLDDVLLADPVQTTDALFQQVRVGRQVEQHQVMGELEVATFTADFRADQHLRAKLFVGEVGGGAVTLEDVHALVEHRGRDAGAHAQGVFQVHGGFGVGADHQHFGALEHLQLIDQPFDARVEFPPAFFFAGVRLGLEADFRVQLGVIAQWQFEVFVRARQRVRVQLALRETLHGGAGVTEQHAAGAVAVQQLAHQARAGFGVAIVDGGQQGFAFVAEEAVDGLVGLRRQASLVQQLLNGFSHRAIVFALGAEGLQVVETVRVEQAQTSEVAVLAQLFRGGGQQQHAGNGLGELLYQGILGADLIFVPHQVVSLVDHQQVPARREQRVLGFLVVHQPLKRDQCELGVFEGVAGIAFDEAFFVEQRDLQVKAAAHLDQPLVLQVFRNQDQHAVGAAREQLAMDHQAGFDGFAQAHFVGQQNPWRDTVGDFAGNVQLVRDRLRTHAAQTPKGGLQLATGVFQCVVTQGEPGQRVDLAGEQTVAGQAELDEVRQLGFRQGDHFVLPVEAVVNQQAIDVVDFANGQLPAFEVSDGVTGRKPHTGEGRIP
ncbi:hypothetical protein D3C84_512530 [compost metagenome]